MKEKRIAREEKEKSVRYHVKIGACAGYDYFL